MKKFWNIFESALSTFMIFTVTVSCLVGAVLFFSKVPGSTGFASIGLFFLGLICAGLFLIIFFMVGGFVYSQSNPDGYYLSTIIDEMKKNEYTFSIDKGLLVVEDKNGHKDIFKPNGEKCYFTFNGFSTYSTFCKECQFYEYCKEKSKEE